MTTDTLPIGIVPGMPFDEYAADPGLNASTLRRFRKSAKEGAYKCGLPDLPSPAMLLGRALHEYLDSPATFDDRSVTVEGLKPKALPKTFAKAVEEHPDEIVLAEGWRDLVLGMGEAALAHPKAGVLLRQKAETEVSLFWDDQDLGVRCKARLDRLTAIGIQDPKTTSEIDPEGMEKSIARFGYHMQAAWYIRALNAVRGDVDPAFAFIFIESTPPHDVAVVDLIHETIAQGWAECVIAAGRWKHWKETGSAPGVSADVLTCGLPKWAELPITAPYPLLRGHA